MRPQPLGHLCKALSKVTNFFAPCKKDVDYRRSVYVSSIQFRYNYENRKLEIAYRISMYRHLCDHEKQKHTIRFATTPFREQSNIELTVSIFPSDVIGTTEMDSSVPIFIL